MIYYTFKIFKSSTGPSWIRSETDYMEMPPDSMSHVGALMLQCSMLSSMVIIRRWRLPRMCITVRTLSIQSETLAQTICVGAQTQMATKDQCKLDCWMIISVVTLFRWAQRTSQLLTKIDRCLGSWIIKVKKKTFLQNNWSASAGSLPLVAAVQWY